MDGLEDGKLLENAFEDPLFNLWSYLSPPDLIAASQVSKEIKEKSVFGFIANEIFAGFNYPLIFDNSADYDLEQLIIQLKRYGAAQKSAAIGSTHQNPQPQMLSSRIPTDAESAPGEHDVAEEEAGMFLIEGRLESASFDEYDDFTPRHPVPKDKVHRRGDSYFNSDITEAARLAADPTVSAAIRKFAKITLETEKESELEDDINEIKPVVSPHIPSFRISNGTTKNIASVFTFEEV